MYPSPSSGRTMIKVGGNDRSKVEPLYSIPIQTTATLNIQLLPLRATSTTSTISTNQSAHQAMVIGAGAGGGGGGGPTAVRTSGPVNAAVSATRVNIVAEVPSRRTSSILSDDSSSSLGTQTDRVPEGPPSYDIAIEGRRSGFSTTSSQADWSSPPSSDASQTGGFPADPAVQAGVVASSRNQETRFSETESQFGGFPQTRSSQVGYSDSGSQIGESYLLTPALASTAGGSTSSAAPPGSSSVTSANPWSSSSSSSMTSGGSVVTPVTASLLTSSNSGKESEEGEGSEFRVFTDANGGKIGAGEATVKAKQLAQGILKALTLNDGSRDVRSKDTVEEEEEDDDDDGWEELGRPAGPSTFNLIEWDLPNEKSSKQLACHRVIIMKDKEMVLMLKAACSTQKTGNDPRLLTLMVEIAENCSRRLKKMTTLPNLRAQHMDTLPLSDGRPTKERLTAVSKTLKDNIVIKEVAYRFQPAGDVYVGTFVQGTVLAKRNFAIGKVGVVAVLFKKSKYATVEAFSEQLCEHIAIAQPTTLGHLSDADLKRLNRRGTTRIQHLQKDQLLVQNFIFDPTIIVAEAARRSFVRIDDFLLFK